MLGGSSLGVDLIKGLLLDERGTAFSQHTEGASIMLVTMRSVQRWLRQVNLFESDSLDEQTLQHERRSSWLYIALFTGILVSLSMYTGVGSQTSSVTINHPTYGIFEALHQKYPKTLNCPCSHTATQFSKCIQSHVTFHQVGQMNRESDELPESIRVSSRLMYLFREHSPGNSLYREGPVKAFHLS
jgi:hypothetical protein